MNVHIAYTRHRNLYSCFELRPSSHVRFNHYRHVVGLYSMIYGNRSSFITSTVVSEWAEWSAWSDCTGDCQSATQTRSRRCNGQSCSGSDQETKKCVPIVKEQGKSNYHHYKGDPDENLRLA